MIDDLSVSARKETVEHTNIIICFFQVPNAHCIQLLKVLFGLVSQHLLVQIPSLRHYGHDALSVQPLKHLDFSASKVFQYHRLSTKESFHTSFMSTHIFFYLLNVIELHV